jgi:hypothetical protein
MSKHELSKRLIGVTDSSLHISLYLLTVIATRSDSGRDEVSQHEAHLLLGPNRVIFRARPLDLTCFNPLSKSSPRCLISIIYLIC